MATGLTASWIRVFQGLHLVANSVAKLTAKEGGTVLAKFSQHGVDLAHNARTAVYSSHIILNEPYKHMNQPNSNTMHDDSVHVITRRDLQIKDEPVVSMENVNNNDISSKKSATDNSNDEDDVPHPPKDANSHMQATRHQTIQEGSAVPSTRLGRAFGFASLGFGLVAGTVIETASRLTNRTNHDSKDTNSSSLIHNERNANRIAKTLCRMRGAALKLGQMLSIQDETLLPHPLSQALEQVRQGAEAMPRSQLQQQMKKEYQTDDWREKFVSFHELPFAAASIGQCHRAVIRNLAGQNVDVVVKVQYPGVADSIESDLSNLTMLVKMTGLAPKGLFLDRVIQVGRDELKVECDYIREAKNQQRLRDFVHNDPHLQRAKFRIPQVFTELSTKSILVTEYCLGGTIDKVAFLDQKERNRIGRNIMRLTIKELFEWRFMQTDPNWGNFLYDVGTGMTSLIDFGSAREFSKSFIDGYLRIVWACAQKDTDTLMSISRRMGFLTGDENEIMLEAHKMSGFVLGEPFATDDAYDFKDSGITGRISDHGSAFLQHRLTPPPEEVYTLHRKLAGTYNLCIKLGANIKCRDLLIDILERHEFEDGLEHPLHGSL